MKQRSVLVENGEVETAALVDPSPLQDALTIYQASRQELEDARAKLANHAAQLAELDGELAELRLKASVKPVATFGDLTAVKALGREKLALQAEIDALGEIRIDLLGQQRELDSMLRGAEMLAWDAKQGTWRTLFQQLTASLPVGIVTELPNAALMAGMTRLEMLDAIFAYEDSSLIADLAIKYQLPV